MSVPLEIFYLGISTLIVGAILVVVVLSLPYGADTSGHLMSSSLAVAVLGAVLTAIGGLDWLLFHGGYKMIITH